MFGHPTRHDVMGVDGSLQDGVNLQAIAQADAFEDCIEGTGHIDD
jgi:hypothetical protein